MAVIRQDRLRLSCLLHVREKKGGFLIAPLTPLESW